ncbi:uncharacterized protein NPIL_643031 [Nephila pilipes]|uniref:Uncharacterized protein n=1 Tax=Nephila pilipes TaxID=299642 RepID=A0A8X6QSA4_NEPPI|nr:uncharacterized protein NPIL_643031 [Nephila pilipes]
MSLFIFNENIMSDSNDDKSLPRRSKRAKKSDDSEASDKPVDPSDRSTDSSAKPAEDDASKDKPVASSAAQPSGSYGGARPKIYPQKKEDKPKKSSDTPRPSARGFVQRAVDVLEAVICRRREAFRRRREEAKKAEHHVAMYLGPDWIDSTIEEEKTVHPPGSITHQLRELARNTLISEFDRRRREGREDSQAWIPLEHRLADPPIKQPLSDKPVKTEFEDEFKAESDPDDRPQMKIKLPDLKKKSRKIKPKTEEPPPEPSKVVEHRKYYFESISRYMFIDRPPFVRPEFETEVTDLKAYLWLDAIFVQHGIEDWRRFALAAYQTGRYHTEQQIRTAREQLAERNVTDEEFLEMYHIVRRDYVLDEGCNDDFSNLVERILAVLNTMEKIATAMLYMDIWQNRLRREEARQKEMVAKVLKVTERIGEIEHSTSADASLGDQDAERSASTGPSTSVESSASIELQHSASTERSASSEHPAEIEHSGSDIVDDVSSKSEEKTPPFFYETLREYVTIDIEYRPRHLTLEDRPPSILSSSDKSSTPIPPSPVEIASPSPEGIASPDIASPPQEESETDSKSKIYKMAPVRQASAESSSSSSSRKSLKRSFDKLIDTSSSTPLSAIRSPIIQRLRELDSPDNTSGSVSPLPVDSPSVPELEEGMSSEVDVERVHIVPHVLVTAIMENVMNSVRERLASLFLGDVPEQADEGFEADSPSQSSGKNASTDSDDKRKENMDSDEESSKEGSKKHRMEQ